MIKTNDKLAKNVPFNFINGTLTLFVGDKQFSVGKEDCRMGKIKECLMDDENKTEDDLLKILNSTSIESYVSQCSDSGKAELKDGEVYFNGVLVSSVLTERIKECMKFGLPFDHMLRFMENISANPSYRSQTELFDFLGNKSLPITPDGCFLAYKAIRDDWYDKYSGTILNTIGTKVVIPRNNVDDAREHECSFGLHVGALPYVKSYGNGSTDRVVYVKVNPKDVVAVPKDYNAQKVRVCEYLVIEEYKGELDQSPVYDNNMNPQGSPINNDEWDDNWDDEEDDGFEDTYEPTYYDEYEDEDEEFEDGFEEDDDEYGCGVYQPPYQSPNPLPNPLYNPLAKEELDQDKYGVKPSGQKFYNVHGQGGRFVKQ